MPTTIPDDWIQPARGYRFTGDSVKLALFCPYEINGTAADLGAGCGVVLLEALAQGRLLGATRVVLVERDPAFLPHLEANIARAEALVPRLPPIQAIIADWRELEPHDLGGPVAFAASNPPYYKPGTGRLPFPRAPRSGPQDANASSRDKATPGAGAPGRFKEPPRGRSGTFLASPFAPGPFSQTLAAPSASLPKDFGSPGPDGLSGSGSSGAPGASDASGTSGPSGISDTPYALTIPCVPDAPTTSDGLSAAQSGRAGALWRSASGIIGGSSGLDVCTGPGGSIGDGASIPSDASTGPGGSIGDGTAIPSDASAGPGGSIGDGAAIPSDSSAGSGGSIGSVGYGASIPSDASAGSVGYGASSPSDESLVFGGPIAADASIGSGGSGTSEVSTVPGAFGIAGASRGSDGSGTFPEPTGRPPVAPSFEESQEPSRAGGRWELHGDIASLMEAAARILAPGGLFRLCYPRRKLTELLAAASAVGLRAEILSFPATRTLPLALAGLRRPFRP
ncbi:MAG: RsmD family RNA methyltransferase [Deltaproteobacteria bacterium]|nr:RsmD family RNA methyltransferase [Deltaproteobacteria bacterium]